MHHHKIAHRDLKGDNIFLTDDKIIKIGDFSSAKPLSGTHTKPKELSAETGTWSYMAPEVITGSSNIGRSADIWSFACLLIETVNTGQMVGFKSLDKKLRSPVTSYEIISIIGDGAKPSYGLAKSIPWLSSLLDSCLRPCAQQRPNASQLLEHPFITNENIGRSSSKFQYVQIPDYQSNQRVASSDESGYAKSSVIRELHQFAHMANSIKTEAECTGQDYSNQLLFPVYSPYQRSMNLREADRKLKAWTIHRKGAPSVLLLKLRLPQLELNRSAVIRDLLDEIRELSKPTMHHENLVKHYGWDFDARLLEDKSSLKYYFLSYTEHWRNIGG